jgi:hypothetical protein
MNTETIQPQLQPHRPFPAGALAVAAVVLSIVGIPVAASLAQSSSYSDASASVDADCDRYANAEVEKLAAQGKDLPADAWVRQRQMAFEACQAEASYSAWLQNGM